MKLNKLYRKIDKYDVISFDIFDTLIIRAVNNPKQIFDVVGNNFNEFFHKKTNDYKEKRILCEKKITDHVPNLDDIYAEMAKFYTKEECNWLKNNEIETEKKYCILNRKIQKLYNYCIEKNKIIYAVSDMYLPSKILKEILQKCGYNKIKKIIVSCEKGYTKDSGLLFKEIPYNKNKILHIGDSFKADYFGAHRAGIKSIKISRKHFDNSNDNCEQIININDKFNNYFYNIGYEKLGLVLLMFARWIEENLRNKKINKIYFLAREGKIYKDVFDLLYTNKYETKYLYISRKSITLANYHYRKFNNLTEILDYFTIKKNSTINDAINYLNVSIKFDKNKMDDCIYNYVNDDLLYKELSNKIQQESRKVNNETLAYFEQENIENDFAIVDIGWNGTMQKCLGEFLKNNNVNFNMNGFYFTLFKKLRNASSFVKNDDFIFNSIKDNPILLENLFQCVDGSTIGYKKVDNKIIPAKRKIEFDDYSQCAIKEIDKGIIDFINIWKTYGFVNNYSILYNKAMYNLSRFIDKPSKQSVIMFSNFKYSDTKVSNIIYTKTNLFNIKNGIVLSGWKYGYLKKIFKFNFNYKKIVKVLKRCK